jgi:glycogen operon protein
VLSQVKMIAEPWDMGPYGYQVGGFGPGWSEWNDRFRNHVRDFWRGNTHGVGELAQRLTGSPDIFDRNGRHSTSSVNFLTAHDGFTMRDLVTYNVKHNGTNGESNRDGSDDNRSWNCGFEGETEDPAINARRHRQVQNLMATLILATGVPMITAGDELGRSQEGNNNAYCQDSPISWVHWDTQETWSDQTELTRKLLQLRAEHPVFRRDRFRQGEFLLDAKGQPDGRKNIAWFGGNNAEMTEPEWRDATRRTVGIYLADDDPYRATDEAFLVWFHAGSDAIQVQLPNGPWADNYTVIAHSGMDGELPLEKMPAGSALELPALSVVVLQVD